MVKTSREVLTYREAICAAMEDEMAADPGVVLLGEDVGAAGGPFKTSVGLYQRFGAERVIDTPISETGFVGAALGMAISGFRPIVELMFADFMGVCMDQIINSIAKYRYMSGGQFAVPLVIRCVGGGGLQFGAQHSQTGESWLMNVPGLKICTASSPAAAYSLLRNAVRDPNPVICFEHKALYGVKGEVERTAPEPAAVTGPAVLRPGRDVTLVATMAMVDKALKAADQLAAQGIEAEVIELRWLRPFDDQALVESVKRTNRLVTVEEQAMTGGWGGEVVARVTAGAFDYLDAPPERVCLPESPLPFSPVLEEAAIPQPARIVQAVLSMMGR